MSKGELPSRLSAPTGEVNPYASPAIPDPLDPLREAGIGAWQDGTLLVLHPEAPLPLVCLKSGYPATRLVNIKIKVAWIPPGFVWWPPKLKLDVPLCEWRIWWFERGPWVLAVALAAMLVIPPLFFLPLGSRLANGTFFVAVVVIIASAVSAADCRNILVFQKTRGGYFWLRGAHPSFLQHLPPWPYGS